MFSGENTLCICYIPYIPLIGEIHSSKKIVGERETGKPIYPTCVSLSYEQETGKPIYPTCVSLSYNRCLGECYIPYIFPFILDISAISYYSFRGRDLALRRLNLLYRQSWQILKAFCRTVLAEVFIEERFLR